MIIYHYHIISYRIIIISYIIPYRYHIISLSYHIYRIVSLSYHISYIVIISYIISYPTIIIYHNISYIISYHISYIIYHIIPYHIIYRIIPYHIIYHIIYHIVSYHYHIIYHIISPYRISLMHDQWLFETSLSVTLADVTFHCCLTHVCRTAVTVLHEQPRVSHRCYSTARTATCSGVKGPSFRYGWYSFRSFWDISRDRNCSRYSAGERAAEVRLSM